MYSVGLNSFQHNYITTDNIKSADVKNIEQNNKVQSNQPASNPVSNKISYNPAFTASAVRTRLSSSEEKNKYNTISEKLDKNSRKQMKDLLKTGILLMLVMMFAWGRP